MLCLPASNKFELGMRIGPVDPRSRSLASSLLRSEGVNQSSRDSPLVLTPSFKTLSENSVTPFQSPLPVSKYVFPELSIGGARSACQTPPCRPFGVVHIAPTCCSVLAL